MYINVTMILPADLAPLARSLAAHLAGPPGDGMWVTGLEPDGTVPDAVPSFVSSGPVGVEFEPLLTDADALWGAVQAGTPGSVTMADCAALVAALDLTEAEPHGRMDFVRDEVADAVTAPAWVQPTGAHDAYPMDAAVTHAGKGWRNLTPANVWEPGVSGWRELWGQGGANEWPDWVQPTGAHDAYPLGAKVTHNGERWVSTAANNVWEPGVFGWEKQ